MVEEYPWWHEADSALSKIHDQIISHCDSDQARVNREALKITTNLGLGALSMINRGSDPFKITWWFQTASAQVIELVEDIAVMESEIYRHASNPDWAKTIRPKFEPLLLKRFYRIREMIQEKYHETHPPPRESPSIPGPKPRKRKRGAPKYIR